MQPHPGRCVPSYVVLYVSSPLDFQTGDPRRVQTAIHCVPPHYQTDSPGPHLFEPRHPARSCLFSIASHKRGADSPSPLRPSHQVLSGVVEGSVLRCALDRPHAAFIFAELVCGPKTGGAPGAAVGASGWVTKSELVLATALTASYTYAATTDDEVGFDAGALVFSFAEMDGWRDGFVPATAKCGVFPGNYVTVASPQPAFTAAAPPPHQAAAPPPQAAAAAAPPPPYSPAPAATTNPLTGGKGSGRDPEVGGGGKVDRFKGEKPLQYAVWGHNMGLGCAFVCFWCGLFTILWADAQGWECKVDGGATSIHASFIVNASLPGCDAASLAASNRRDNDRTCCAHEACCDPNDFKDVNLNGSSLFGEKQHETPSVTSFVGAAGALRPGTALHRPRSNPAANRLALTVFTPAPSASPTRVHLPGACLCDLCARA